MSEPLILYRADQEQLKPVAVECQGGLQGTDADGVQVGASTHFPTEADAWNRLYGDAYAAIYIAGDVVANARLELLKANEQAAVAAVQFAELDDHYAAWVKAQRPQPADPEEECDE